MWKTLAPCTVPNEPVLVQRISKGGSRRRSKGAVKVQNKQSNEEIWGYAFVLSLLKPWGVRPDALKVFEFILTSSCSKTQFSETLYGRTICF